MSGRFTRKMYDGCSMQQNVKQSTDPLELVLDVNKYVHCNNICRPTAHFPPNAAQLVDVESSLMGIDKLASDCDSSKHPFCGPNGCLLTKDPRVAPHITPYACERGHLGDNAVVTTNMQMPLNSGYRVPNTNICGSQGNGYYSDQNNIRGQSSPSNQNNRVQQILRSPQNIQTSSPQYSQTSSSQYNQSPQNGPSIRDQQVKLPIQQTLKNLFAPKRQ